MGPVNQTWVLLDSRWCLNRVSLSLVPFFFLFNVKRSYNRLQECPQEEGMNESLFGINVGCSCLCCPIRPLDGARTTQCTDAHLCRGFQSEGTWSGSEPKRRQEHEEFKIMSLKPAWATKVK